MFCAQGDEGTQLGLKFPIWRSMQVVMPRTSWWLVERPVCGANLWIPPIWRQGCGTHHPDFSLPPNGGSQWAWFRLTCGTRVRSCCRLSAGLVPVLWGNACGAPRMWPTSATPTAAWPSTAAAWWSKGPPDSVWNYTCVARVSWNSNEHEVSTDAFYKFLSLLVLCLHTCAIISRFKSFYY